MFKDYDKFFATSLKVYTFVLLFIFILKIVGLDYFGMEVDNPALINLNKFITNYHLENVWYAFTIYIYAYIIIGITVNENSKRLALYILALLPLMIFMQVIKSNNSIFLLIDFVYLLLLALLYLKLTKQKIQKVNITNYIVFNFITILLQVISMVTRNKPIQLYGDNFIVNFIYNLDYLIMMIIFHHLYFKKGSNNLCSMVVSSSLQRLTSLKKFLKRLQRKSQSNNKNNKELSKEDKISNIIYVILSVFWNLFTLALIGFVAILNETAIECIFITFSFWVTKTVFGKAFHFESVITCFIVSNLTYYVLNKITTPLGISIFIPILLGVGLSYVTSKFVKKSYKPLYRGMPEDLFNETILNIVDKDSTKYKICYEFYIEKQSDVSLSFRYNYSVPGIRKIRNRINKKIEGLNS